jgi:hypothetical protein
MTPQPKRNLVSLISLAVVLFLSTGCLHSSSSNNSNNSKSGPAATATQPSAATQRPAGATQYSNSSVKFGGHLQENYVDFSFDYPSGWKRDPDAGKGNSPNFVKVENATGDQITLENFAVGYFSGQRELMPELANQMSQQFARNFPGYKKVSEGETKIGSYDGYEFRFTAHVKDTPKGDLDLWGRTVLLPGSEERKGAVLTMFATSASDKIHDVNEVGEKGELPIILSSFRFEKN